MDPAGKLLRGLERVFLLPVSGLKLMWYTAFACKTRLCKAETWPLWTYVVMTNLSQIFSNSVSHMWLISPSQRVHRYHHSLGMLSVETERRNILEPKHRGQVLAWCIQMWGRQSIGGLQTLTGSKQSLHPLPFALWNNSLTHCDWSCQSGKNSWHGMVPPNWLKLGKNKEKITFVIII